MFDGSAASQLADVATSGSYADLSDKPASLTDFTADLSLSSLEVQGLSTFGEINAYDNPITCGEIQLTQQDGTLSFVLKDTVGSPGQVLTYPDTAAGVYSLQWTTPFDGAFASLTGVPAIGVTVLDGDTQAVSGGAVFTALNNLLTNTIAASITDKAPTSDAVHRSLSYYTLTTSLGTAALSNSYNDLDDKPSSTVQLTIVTDTSANPQPAFMSSATPQADVTEIEIVDVVSAGERRPVTSQAVNSAISAISIPAVVNTVSDGETAAVSGDAVYEYIAGLSIPTVVNTVSDGETAAVSGDAVYEYIAGLSIPSVVNTVSDGETAAVSGDAVYEYIAGLTIPSVTDTIEQDGTDAASSGGVYTALQDYATSTDLSSLIARVVKLEELFTAALTIDRTFIQCTSDTAHDTSALNRFYIDGNSSQRDINTTSVFDHSTYGTGKFLRWQGTIDSSGSSYDYFSHTTNTLGFTCRKDGLYVFNVQLYVTNGNSNNRAMFFAYLNVSGQNQYGIGSSYYKDNDTPIDEIAIVGSQTIALKSGDNIHVVVGKAYAQSSGNIYLDPNASFLTIDFINQNIPAST